MSSTPEQLAYATSQINIYYGSFICIVGTIGGLLNILIFTTLKSFRETTCATYLIAATVYNLCQSFALFFWSTGVGLKLFSLNFSLFCKFRYFFPQYFVLVSHTCMCMAAIDQFLSQTRYRNFNSIRSARFHVLVPCIVWFIHAAFTFAYYESNGANCFLVNSTFFNYYTYFYLPFLLGFFPIIIITIFSLLALYKIVTNTDRQIDVVNANRDRQLSAMTLAHLLFVVISITPFVVVFVYTLSNPAANPQMLARNQLILAITNLFSFQCQAVSVICFEKSKLTDKIFQYPLYIYCWASRRFRKQLIHVLFKLNVNQYCCEMNNLNNNQIAPT